jgi:hypothetical protein
VPLTPWKGTEVQINDARTFARKPTVSIKLADIVDDRLVVEAGKRKASSSVSINSDGRRFAEP